MTDKREKKEKVIHTRVPESLDEEIRVRAETLGISVSNLVRNVLKNAFELVEDVIVDGANIGRAARGELDDDPSGPTPPAGPIKVLGWQELVLNLNALCDGCNDILPKGGQALLAVTDRPGAPPVFRCRACVDGAGPGAPQTKTGG